MPITGELYAFTEKNVDSAPTKHGVYQLYEDDVTTYIGRAAGEGVTIRSRLQSHYRGDEGPCTKAKAATTYKREVTSQPTSREQELLEEYEEEYGGLPRCNERRA